MIEAPEEIVQRQVDAYNRRDLEGFLATYAEDATLYEFPDRVMLSGKTELRRAYAHLFSSSPDILGTVDKRITSGDYVIDQETIRGAGESPSHAVAIYHVLGGSIRSVRFINGSMDKLHHATHVVKALRKT